MKETSIKVRWRDALRDAVILFGLTYLYGLALGYTGKDSAAAIFVGHIVLLFGFTISGYLAREKAIQEDAANLETGGGGANGGFHHLFYVSSEVWIMNSISLWLLGECYLQVVLISWFYFITLAMIGWIISLRFVRMSQFKQWRGAHPIVRFGDGQFGWMMDDGTQSAGFSSEAVAKRARKEVCLAFFMTKGWSKW